MPGRKFSAFNNYRHGFNWQEISSELRSNIYNAQYWEYDSRLGKRWNTDPIINVPESPYLCFNGNPILVTDRLGNTGTSTHTDSKGNIIAVYDDGDLSVYKHQTAKSKQEVDKWRSKFNNKSGNGIKIGETQYWYTFMNTDEKKGTLTTPMYGSNIFNNLDFTAEQLNQVFQDKNQQSTSYGSGKQLLISLKADFKRIMDTKVDHTIPTAAGGLKEYKQLEALQSLSGNNDPYDIKVTLLKPNAGYIYEVNNGLNIYTSGRAMGNILFGENVRQVWDNSDRLKNNYFISMTADQFYNKVFAKVGAYNMRNFTSEQKKKFPMTFQGEHPYSGSFQFLGYWGYNKTGF